MRNRLVAMRELLYDALVSRGVKGDWKILLEQNGMFSFTPITGTLRCEPDTNVLERRETS